MCYFDSTVKRTYTYKNKISRSHTYENLRKKCIKSDNDDMLYIYPVLDCVNLICNRFKFI